MLVYFRQKKEFTTRNYDIAGSGFAPLAPAVKTSENDDHKFRWSLSLIKDLGAIYSSIFLSAIGYGILMVMIALKLQANVKNEVLISLCAATQIGAGVIFARFLPIFGNKFGMVRGIYIASIISAIVSLLLYEYLGYLSFLSVIFVLGTAFFICGVSRNTIMINLAPAHVRALIISVGTMLVAIGNSLGPIILAIIKTGDHFSSFVIASLLYLSSIIPLSRLKKIDSNIAEEKRISLWRYIKNTPKIMIAGFSTSYAMSSASAFAIIYGLQIGMPNDQASLLLSVLLFGTILYLPIGYLCDLLNRRMLMIIFAFLALFCAYCLYVNNDHEKIYTLLFLMFGSLAGVKLPAIVLLNEKYKPTQRLAVNSAFARVSLSGNICGLFATGFIMKDLGPQGLWLSLMVILMIFLLACLINYSRKFAKKEFKFNEFSIFNKGLDEVL